MQQIKIYSIRDSKGDLYGSPFYQNSEPEAVRQFHRLLKDPQSMPNQFPEDYDLYRLGEFDIKTGKITALKAPEHVVKAVQLLKQ